MTDTNTAALARIRQMADYWEQHLPEVIRTPAVVSALRAALEYAAVEPSVDGAALRQRAEAALAAVEAALGDTLVPAAREEALAVIVAVLPAPADRASSEAPAAECSAQNRNYESGPRLCIRAAQHDGDHIDDRGFHWSDTVAVYPLADGTFRTGVNRAALRRMADETPAAEAWQQEWDSRPNGADVSDLVDLQPAETYPPAAAGLPAGTLEAAEIGANRLDAWARLPQGRNFLAHALVQLARTGWLRPEPGEPFEPMREEAPSPEPVAEARQDGAAS